MSAETAENKPEQSEKVSIKARYEKLNKEIISKIDQGLIETVPKEVVARIVVDMFVDQNVVAKMMLRATFTKSDPVHDTYFVEFAVGEVNRCIAEMWNSGKEWGTTDQPLPEQFRHYLSSTSDQPSEPSPDS